MNEETLNNLLAKANECINTGNFDEAETLAGELLAELEKIGESTDTVTARQRDTTHCVALITLSSAKWRRGDYQTALALARTALDFAEEKNLPDETNAKALGNIGIVYLNFSDYPQALTYYQKALAISEEIGNKKGTGGTMVNIGHVYGALGQNATALEYYEKALPIFDEIGEKLFKANALNSIGNVYLHLSDYAQALTYYQKSLAIDEEIGSKDGVARNLGNLGSVYRNLSDYPQALTYFQKALAIYEEIGSKDGIATNLGNIGLVYGNLSDNQQALTYYQKALAIYQEIGSKHGIATNLCNVGLVYENLSDYPQALTYFQKALAIFEEIGSKEGIANNLGNIGLVYGNLSDNQQALTYLQKALAIFEEIGSKKGIANNIGNIGVLFANDEFDGYDPTKAEEMMLKAMAIDEEIGEKRHLYHVHKSLAYLYKVEKRWEECQMHYEKFYTLEKEVQSEDAHKQAGLMEQRRQAAEREKEIELAKAAAAAKLNATTTLLHRVLPESIATRMIAGEKDIADYFTSVTILFADIAGFTPISAGMPAYVVVRFLNYVFGTFDAIMKRHGCEKIKTIGDGYMAVAGAPIECADHAGRMALAALEMQEDIRLPEEFMEYLPAGTDFGIRIGLHTGSVVGGVIGDERFVYDIYSDAVNTAARMESHGEPDKIHVSEEFKQAYLLGAGQNGGAIMSPVSPMSLHFQERGEMHIKGKGMMKTYFLTQST
ncbi:MAG: tetratricopeptide repeat protein [Ignavibacteria bacterium]|nr:tetratricopeptide repeat protein [Ignavibacteria bacterium]